MKILLCSISSPHELTGIGKYNGELVEWFRENGHHVNVLTTMPYYPYWEIYEGYKDENYKVELSDNGNIYAVRLPVSKKVCTARRLMMDGTFGLKTFTRLPQLARRQKYDIIQLVLPPITALPAAIMAKDAGSAKLHIHVQDLQLEAANELNLLPGFMISMLEALEKRCLRSADYVTTISNNMLAQLKSKITQKSTQTGLVENWADTELIKPIDDKSWLKNKMGYPESTFLIVCSGNIGEKQGVGQILPVAKMLKDHENIQFLILGDGAKKQALAKQRQEQNIDNIRLGDLVPKPQLNRMLNGADIQLVLQKKMAADSFFPSKYINIVSAGIPSVVTARPHTELYSIAEEYETSIVVEPENAQMLAEAILRLYKDKKLRSALSDNARRLALERYGKDAILGALEENYRGLQD